MSKLSAEEWIENFHNSNITEISDLFIPYKKFSNEVNEDRKDILSTVYNIFYNYEKICYKILNSLGIVTVISLFLVNRIIPLFLSLCAVICAIIYGINVAIKNKRVKKVNRIMYDLTHNELNNLIAAFYQLKYKDKDNKDFNEFAEIYKAELDELVQRCKCAMDKAYEEVY